MAVCVWVSTNWTDLTVVGSIAHIYFLYNNIHQLKRRIKRETDHPGISLAKPEQVREQYGECWIAKHRRLWWNNQPHRNVIRVMPRFPIFLRNGKFPQIYLHFSHLRGMSKIVASVHDEISKVNRRATYPLKLIFFLQIPVFNEGASIGTCGIPLNCYVLRTFLFIDLAKVFDRLWYDDLIYNMSQLKVFKSRPSSLSKIGLWSF